MCKNVQAFTDQLSFDFHQTFTKAPLNFHLTIIRDQFNFPFHHKGPSRSHFPSFHWLPSLIHILEAKMRSGQSWIYKIQKFRWKIKMKEERDKMWKSFQFCFPVQHLRTLRPIAVQTSISCFCLHPPSPSSPPLPPDLCGGRPGPHVQPVVTTGTLLSKTGTIFYRRPI